MVYSKRVITQPQEGWGKNGTRIAQIRLLWPEFTMAANRTGTGEPGPFRTGTGRTGHSNRTGRTGTAVARVEPEGTNRREPDSARTEPDEPEPGPARTEPNRTEPRPSC